jgi:hypothetical protein
MPIFSHIFKGAVLFDELLFYLLTKTGWNLPISDFLEELVFRHLI